MKLHGMPPGLASYTASMLEEYYLSFILPKKVVRDMDVYSTVQSFKLPSEVGDEPLSKDAPDNVSLDHIPTVKLVPKDDADSCMLDFGACTTGFCCMHP